MKTITLTVEVPTGCFTCKNCKEYENKPYRCSKLDKEIPDTLLSSNDLKMCEDLWKPDEDVIIENANALIFKP